MYDDAFLGKLSSSFKIVVSDANQATTDRPAINLVDTYGEHTSLKMLLALQSMAVQCNQVPDMKDLSFLEKLQAGCKDLVPRRYDTVEEYLRSRSDYTITAFATGAVASDFGGQY